MVTAFCRGVEMTAAGPIRAHPVTGPPPRRAPPRSYFPVAANSRGTTRTRMPQRATPADYVREALVMTQVPSALVHASGEGGPTSPSWSSPTAR